MTTVKKPSDQIYIDFITSGNSEGLQQIYKLFLPRITQFITRNGGNADDAKDVFQDAIIIIYEKAKHEDFTLSSGFYTLLYGICRNVWGNRLQKKSRQTVTLLDDYKYSNYVVDGLNELIEREEEAKVFWSAFQKLGEDCQRLLRLFFDKVKMSEIVKIMGLSSESYAKKRKFVCKERLVKLVRADARFAELKRSAP